MSAFYLLLCLHLLLIPLSFGDIFSEIVNRPKIEVRDGHLKITVPKGKDIKLTTDGGRIIFNGQDTTGVTKAMTQWSENVNQIVFDNNIQKAGIKLNKINVEGLSNRMEVLEKNLTTVNMLDLLYGHLSRRLKLLQKRIRKLNLLLTQNDCISNPCEHGGTCQDLFNGYMCQCPDQWEGPRCENDVNECIWFTGTDLGCQNGATCINKPGHYMCSCAEGWHGIHCTKRKNDCSSNVEMCSHGTCIPQNSGVGYTCLCDQGWKTDGIKPACTVDVNECESYKPPCSSHPPVACFNFPGTFHCANCPPGYTGNGFYCSDIDECELFNGGCSMNPLVQCINKPGSRVCGMCPPGYIGDGVTCSYQGGVCGINNGGCYPSAQCRENSRISRTYVECICPSGYTGEGFGPNGCVKGGAEDLCASNPCGLYGTCTTTSSGTYTCRCNARYTGRNCHIRKNDCTPNPCENGGTCTSIIFSYVCTCAEGYTGVNCQNEKDMCGLRTGLTGHIVFPAVDKTMVIRNCAWVIQVPADKVINITFKSFKFSACSTNFLQINDGKNAAALLIGRFCGNELPKGGSFVSTHSNLYIWIKGDGTTQNKFELSWNATNPMCGGDINVTSHGSFRSPGSPGNYPLNRDCYWRFRAPLGKRIQFHFFSLMIGSNKDCNQDFLQFHEGLETTDPLIIKFCNTTHPEPLLSAGNEVLAYFHTNERGSFPGFQISYSLTEGIPGCGGVYTMPEGEITSPKVSGVYPRDSLCEYQIRLPGVSKIKLMFHSFKLEDSTTCEYDYVAIHDGRSIDSPLIGKFCGETPPGPLLSVGRDLLIVFRSDFSSEAEGFKLSYETVCGGKYMEATGTIQSQNYPNPQTYQKPTECIYEISRPQGSTIIMNVTYLDLASENVTECYNGFFEIRDGDNENSTLIGKYCDKPPPTVYSTYNYLWIKYLVLRGTVTGFKLNYVAQDNNGCGGILKSKVGFIESPGDLNNYKNGLICSWHLIAPTDYVIQLTWIKFNLEESYSCTYDYVRVFDNATTPANKIGEYCGNKLPPTLVSTGNVMTLQFGLDGSENLEGFLLSYTFIHTKNICGGRYFTSTGIIKSPNFPDNYPANRDCVWIITVPLGQQILLNASVFDIELYFKCRYDHLEIRNGGTAASPLIGKFCGTSIPKKITSHANQLYLRFKSDMSKSSQGFNIEWTSASTGCGGTLSSPTGTIISPHYPEPYGKNAECFWKIVVSVGSFIQMVFSDLDLEQHPGCFLDYVEILDGPDAQAKSLGKYCIIQNNAAPVIKSSSNQVTIKFRSDISFQGRGFQLQYVTICNNKVSGFMGVIESPNFPNPYSHEQTCLWEIGVSEGNKINITFSHFSVGMSLLKTVKNCDFDYLQISYPKVVDYGDVQTEVYGKFCDNEIPPDITINANKTDVKYVVDHFFEGTGFRLEWYLFGCGGVLTNPTGTISTPNYPNAYASDTQCNWHIKTDVGNSIKITFEHVDLEHSTECSYDYIIVYNGADDTHPEMTTFCTSFDKNYTLTTSGPEMYVRFQSDSSYRGRGFIASYTTVASKCGGALHSFMGNVHSPNYPKNYDKNDSCVWTIEVLENHVVELSFQDFDFPKSCGAYVKVFDGPSEGYPVLAKLCGNVKPNGTIVSTNNYMTLEMVTLPFYTSKGFSAKYQTSCGSKIKSSGRGLISYDSYSIPEENCTWTIEAEKPEQHVFLTITHLDSQCYSNYGMFIYNGEDSAAPLIGTYCGTRIPQMIRSAGNKLFIEITSDVKFDASYSVGSTDCGGTLFAVSGVFASPDFPNNYPIDISCEWTLKVNKGNRIHLEFSDFDITTSKNCNEDYLEVREDSSEGKLLGEFCGNEVPQNITSNTTLWLSFRSDKPSIGDTPTTGKGFKATFTLMHGNELYGSTGTIESPLYPKLYSNTDYDSIIEHVYWKITVGASYQIRLKFLDFYSDYTEDECYSSVKFYDGDGDIAPLIAARCGAQIPEPIESSSNVLYISSMFDNARKGTKFLLKWEVFYKYISITHSTRNVTGCGSPEPIAIANGEKYNLTHVGVIRNRFMRYVCSWTFETTKDKHLAIKFNKINLGESLPCLFNHKIGVYRIENGHKTLIENLCSLNNSRSKILYSSEGLEVRYNHYRVRQGFNATYSFSAEVYEVCGGSMDMPTGIINLRNVRRFSECDWNVTVGPGKTIQIEFLNLTLGNPPNDCKNYVILKNGQYYDSPYLGDGKFCGDNLPPILKTTGNFLYVKYITTIPDPLAFELKYSEVSISCGGVITLTDDMNITSIHTPNYPNVPNPHIECEWRIVAPGGESVRLDFMDRFDLLYDSTCSLEGVIIRDGGTKLSPIVGKFCGDIPGTQRSTGNMMYVRYYTKTNFPNNGFIASVSISKCGGTVRTSGEIQSPYSHFTPDLNCTWVLIGPEDHYLKIDFIKIDLPRTDFPSNCSDDDIKVRIYEKNVINDTLINNIGEYCGTNPATDIKSESNKVFVNFATGSKIQQTKVFDGFKLRFKSIENDCGGTLTAGSGTIQTPSLSAKNNNPMTCMWYIKVAKGRRIKVTIEDFDFNKNVGIFRHGLAVFDGERESSHAIYLDTDSKRVFRSSDNSITILFWSIYSYSYDHKGLKATYTSDEPTVCIGDLDGSDGTIITPNSTNFKCTWIRTTPLVGQTLAVTINANFSHLPFPCVKSYSYIEAKLNGDDSALVDLCKTTKDPMIIRSSMQHFELIASSINPKNIHYALNFTLTYKVYDCGGLLTDSLGYVSSPLNAHNASECSWQIRVSKGANIQLTFTYFEFDDDCDKNHLTIHNGETVISPQIGKYCQNSQPPTNITSESNYLVLEYHRSSNSLGKGFNVSYAPVTDGCGGIVNSVDYIIQTPHYPQSYPNNAECLWEIRAPIPGYHISIDFVGRFQLESSEKCENDFVQIYNKFEDKNDTSVKKYCGREPPVRSINSTSNTVFVLFRSSSRTSGIGFRIRWKLICGGVFQATNELQYIISPGYPVKYYSSLRCNYTIILPNQLVLVKFEDFHLEDGSGCIDDRVEVERYAFSLWPLRKNIMKYCGTQTPPPIRARNKIEIIFITDKWINKKGFKFSYKADTCGGNFTQPGIIIYNQAIVYSVYDFRVSLCVWNITAPKNKRINIKFKSVNITRNYKCGTQYVKVSDSNGTLAALCGNLEGDLPVIHTNQNTMEIKLRLTSQFRRLSSIEAFTYFTDGPETGCGADKVIPANGTNIISFKHSAYQECIWRLSTVYGYALKLDINPVKKCSTDLNSDVDVSNCTCALYEIRDGITSASELIDQVCDFDAPDSKTYYTSTHRVFIKIYSLGKEHTPNIKVTSVLSPCGLRIRIAGTNTAFLNSPNYPNQYPKGIKCIWEIKAYQRTRNIAVRFVEMDMNNNYDYNKTTLQQCRTGDRLVFTNTSPFQTTSLDNFDIHTEYSPIGILQQKYLTKHIFCSKHDKNYEFYATGDSVTIKFFSNNDEKHGKGFNLAYEYHNCSRNYTNLQGRILKNYSFGNCSLYVKVPKDYTISLYFRYFQFTTASNCNRHSLKVYDDNEKGKLLLSTCDNAVPNSVFSNSNEILIKFFSANRFIINLFDATYTATNKGRGCGGDIYDTVGVLTSPMYPETYMMDVTCTWNIYVPLSQKVSLSFRIFDVAGPCEDNFVTVSTYVDGKFYERTFCKENTPADLISEKQIIVTYKSHPNNLGTGWSAKFQLDTALPTQTRQLIRFG